MHPERLPLRVIGDGHAPRYHDDESGRITLHGRESLLSLNVIGKNVSELRFYDQCAVEGLTAWEEPELGGVARKSALALSLTS